MPRSLVPSLACSLLLLASCGPWVDGLSLAGKGSAPRCSTDGSEAHVAGTFLHRRPDGSHALAILLPDCRVCRATEGSLSALTASESWGSTYSGDRASIDVGLNATSGWATTDAAGTSLVVGAADPPLERTQNSGFTCDGVAQ